MFETDITTIEQREFEKNRKLSGKKNSGLCPHCGELIDPEVRGDGTNATNGSGIKLMHCPECGQLFNVEYPASAH